MGLLDQAIREHLELKRQHGADPGEVARLEREALGPPVRETQEVLTATTGPAGAPPAAAQMTPPAPEPEPWADEPRAESAHQATAPFNAEQAMVDEANGSGGAAAPTEAAPAAGEPPPPSAADPTEPTEPTEPTGDPLATGDEPTAPAAPEPAAADPAASPPVEDSPEGGTEGEAGEDVLEETPEFLQETPEHDRLWFEQRPPRDFDFDD